MGQVVVVGLDIAKSVFQAHGVDRDGEVGGDRPRPPATESLCCIDVRRVEDARMPLTVILVAHSGTVL
jgi:hypothetical protein